MPYTTGFVVPVVLSWLLAAAFVGGFGASNSNTRAGLILWPILFVAWFGLRRLIPIPRGGWGWQTAVIFIGITVAHVISPYVSNVVSGLVIGGVWVGLHVAISGGRGRLSKKRVGARLTAGCEMTPQCASDQKCPLKFAGTRLRCFTDLHARLQRISHTTKHSRRLRASYG